MIFGRQLLFVHVPKTGGMALTELLLSSCDRPLYYSHPEASRRLNHGVVELDGIRHETLQEAATVAEVHGFNVGDFPVILAVVRNPYDIEVSRFGYYRLGYSWDAHHPGRDFAVSGDFKSFVLNAHPHGGQTRPIESYLTLHGRTPPNLRVARFEQLADELQPILSEAGIDASADSMPRTNCSEHGPWRSYYDTESEAAVFERYRALFDSGLYPRLAL